MDPLLNASLHLACSTRNDRQTPLCQASFPPPACRNASALPAAFAATLEEQVSPSPDNPTSMGHYVRRVRNQQNHAPWPRSVEPALRATDSMSTWYHAACEGSAASGNSVASTGGGQPVSPDKSSTCSSCASQLGQAFPLDPAMLAAVQRATNWASSYVPNPNPQVTASFFVSPVPIPSWSAVPAEWQPFGSCEVVRSMVGLPDSYDSSPVIQLWGPHTAGY